MSDVQKQTKKLSFDFDGTLDKQSIQDFAEQLIDMGCEVWITTSRLSPESAPNPDWNNDLFLVAEKLDIPKERIIFTELQLKADEFNRLGTDFVFHLDDDWVECNEINSRTNTVGVSCFGSTSWKNKCLKLLK